MAGPKPFLLPTRSFMCLSNFIYFICTALFMQNALIFMQTEARGVERSFTDQKVVNLRLSIRRPDNETFSGKALNSTLHM